MKKVAEYKRKNRGNKNAGEGTEKRHNPFFSKTAYKKNDNSRKNNSNPKAYQNRINVNK